MSTRGVKAGYSPLGGPSSGIHGTEAPPSGAHERGLKGVESRTVKECGRENTFDGGVAIPQGAKPELRNEGCRVLSIAW